MKDALGRDIPVGAEVLFLLQTGSQPSSKDLWPGKVLRVADGWVEIEYTPKAVHSKRSVTKRFSNVVLVTPEMRAGPVIGATAYDVLCLRGDDSGHWYVIPLAYAADWDRWLHSAAWEEGAVPDYAVRLTSVQGVTFRKEGANYGV